MSGSCSRRTLNPGFFCECGASGGDYGRVLGVKAEDLGQIGPVLGVDKLAIEGGQVRLRRRRAGEEPAEQQRGDAEHAPKREGNFAGVHDCLRNRKIGAPVEAGAGY